MPMTNIVVDGGQSFMNSTKKKLAKESNVCHSLLVLFPNLSLTF